jgi:hypothetical protein
MEEDAFTALLLIKKQSLLLERFSQSLKAQLLAPKVHALKVNGIK